jgi:hypothetical protein
LLQYFSIQNSTFSIVSVSIVAAVSGLYDIVVGALLLFAADAFAATFGVAAASPPIFSDLNALFLLAVGAGYYLPWREPERYRGYMWVMGPLLKGAGAMLFVADYLLRGSPASFLLFAASDGALALLTLYALLARQRSRK